MMLKPLLVLSNQSVHKYLVLYYRKKPAFTISLVVFVYF